MRRKIKSFSDNIRRMFIMYAIIPAFCITLSCLLLIMGIWEHTVYVSNRSSNTKVADIIEATINTYSNELINLSQEETLITKSIDSNRMVEIRRLMYQLYSTTGYRANLYILDNNLNSILSNDEEPQFIIDKSTNNWGILQKIKDNPDQVSYQLNNYDKNLLCIGTGIQKNSRLLGYLVLTLEANVFDLLLTQVSSHTIVTDENGWVYLINSYDFQDFLGRFTRDNIYTNGFIEYQGKKYYLSQSTICNKMFNIYSITSYNLEFKMFNVMIVFIFFIFAAIISITYFISGKVAKKSTKDIDIIAKAFEQVKKGNLDHYLEIDSSVEFKEIGEAFNLMLDGLKTNIQENKELSQLAAFAQVKQLEAQFNPHFLFNTLDNIRFMSKIDAESSDKMIVALSNLLRYSIKDAQEEIQVEEDIRYTESYLTILKIRYNRRLSYTIDVDENVKQCLIPKLMLQSIIENAVKYGYGDRDTLHIWIKGFKVDNDLIFICKDNGSGISEEVLKQIRDNLLLSYNNTNHHGIYNIHRRIRLMYHGDYGVYLESKLGEGTTVTLKLPYSTIEE
ncbi:sensor histidine kinase [Herbinix luporum]|uniref:sensor histidine kinase n=1 Tax=Herbinix luporum TaxID=1679721 RepID=UPI0023F2E990|nr:histidine kinase [Herbinix luporum]